MPKFRKKPIVIEARQYQKDSGRLIPGLSYHHGPWDDATRTRGPLERVTCATLEGPYEVNPGDWIATGVQGEHWPIPAAKFDAIYESLGEGRFRVRPHEREAICMPDAFTLHCTKGDLSGKAGDYLVLATPDDAYPVDAAIFAATYEPAD